VGQPNPQYPTPQDGAAIALTTKFFPLAFFFLFVKPVVTIDNYPVPPAGWGRQVIPVAPGRHQLHVHTPYFLPPRVGPADLVVDVAPGQTAELEYRSPVVVFMGGSLGTPPQKYNGMWVLIALYAVIILACVCVCAGSVLTGNNN
jgi:hypothetical protein